MARCRLPILIVGARADVAPGETEVSVGIDETITTYPWEPHISQLEVLSGFTWVVVPAMGWRRGYNSNNQTRRYWGGRSISRLYQSSAYNLQLQDYYVTTDEESAISNQYWFERQSEKIRQVFSRQFQWAVGLKEFDGYNYLNYLHRRECLVAVTPSGSGFNIKGEKVEDGTKQCEVLIEAAFPDYAFGG